MSNKNAIKESTIEIPFVAAKLGNDYNVNCKDSKSKFEVLQSEIKD